MAPRTRRSQTVETTNNSQTQVQLAASNKKDTQSRRGKGRQMANTSENTNIQGTSETSFRQAYLML